MSDVYVIETNTLELKAPFVPSDVIIKNESERNGLRFESDLLIKSGNFLTLGKWKIDHDDNKLYFYKDGDLKMSLE